MDAFIGEIRAFAYAWPNGAIRAPAGWVPCDGQAYDFKVNPDMTELGLTIGQRFGGSGPTIFNVPNLMGCLPVNVGTASGNGANGSVTWALGTLAGANSVTLTADQMPEHTHAFAVADPGWDSGTYGTPTNGDMLRRPMSASRAPVKAFSTSAGGGSEVELTLGVSTAGGIGNPAATAPHPNIQPCTALAYFICYDGVQHRPA